MPMLPKSSLCLNVPKTGTVFIRYFFDSADYLELKRLCGLKYLTMPNPIGREAVRRIKKYGFKYGSRNCGFTHHVRYSTLPHGVRKYPKICVLRDLKYWYCSYYLYCMGRCSTKKNLLFRTVRRFVYDEDSKQDKKALPILLRHKQEFVDKFKNENVDSIEDISLEFFIWFNQTLKMKAMMNKLIGINSFPREMGFLTFRFIVILFNDPKKVFSMNASEFDEYFASGKYLRDIQCDFFLDFNNFVDQLCSVMVNELGYNREVIAFLKERMDKKNESNKRNKMKVMRKLDGSLFAQILKDEEVYVKYFLPLRWTANR